MEEAHIWQVKYYIYYLTELGYTDIKGVIDYPTLKKKTMVVLKKEEHKKIKKILNDIDIVINNEIPAINKLRGFCKKCAFYDFCYI